MGLPMTPPQLPDFGAGAAEFTLRRVEKLERAVYGEDGEDGLRKDQREMADELKQVKTSLNALIDERKQLIFGIKVGAALMTLIGGGNLITGIIQILRSLPQ